MTRNSRSIIVAVKGIIVFQGRILIVRRAAADVVGAGSWECPGGKIDFGEGLEDALEREIAEETGLSVTVGAVAYAASFLTDPGRQVIIITYHCQSENNIVLLSEEHADYQWCTRSQLQQLLPPGILAEFERSGVFAMEELL
ncbi:NUDIX hydrolase [Paenibacillus sp. FSL R7-0331]|uniref:NUDIX hydrolase n=1 Tax=Paenibacillus sp. FSL R7-0331 TaxID=1536773 RepID=UPI0004F6461B|nr:NUDIX domain-containing protein [Paenibacillus sp. FSL R7-0331]AIQ51863.1 DNA mismatch repair protein MutT [Paenibacillus sp. FSL R7-0331]